MKHGINVKVWCSCSAFNIDGYETFDICIDENLQDIIAFLYYKKYDKPYNELSWYLEEGAREFVKDIEDQWLHNTLDTFSLYKDEEFLEFLSECYTDELDEEQLEDLMEEFKDKVKDELDDLEWRDAKYLNETEGPDIDIWVGPLHESIDLDDYIEDHKWLYEEEDEEEEDD